MSSTRLSTDQRPTTRPRTRRSGRLPAAMGVPALVCLLAACGGSTSGSKDTRDSGHPAAGPVSAASAQGPAAVQATTGASRPAGPVDACKLVTAAEAQAALGKAVRPAKAKRLGSAGASCTYETTDFANGTTAGLALTISYFPHSSMTKARFDAAYRGSGFRSVAGLGEGAWYRGGTLNVYARGANIGVTIVSLTAEATEAQLEPVTRRALARS